MPEPEGKELERVRARRAELREKYVRPKGSRPPTTVQGVHHLALICRDTEETIKFYQEFLGFPLVELVENRDYKGSNHFFFDIGNNNLLGFFDFPGHEHPAWMETIGGAGWARATHGRRAGAGGAGGGWSGLPGSTRQVTKATMTSNRAASARSVWTVASSPT